MPNLNLPPALVERFEANVRRVDGACWIWAGSKAARNYGRVQHLGVIYMAHRISYEIHCGPIPDGMVIDHLCRVHECVNPEHLQPVTQQLNILRGEGPSAVNARKTHCVRGHEFTPENTYLRQCGRRRCRACVALAGTRK